MDDLITFLRARYDEREVKAKAATQGQFGKWMVDEGKHYQDGRARRIVTVAYDPDYALVDESAWPGDQVLTNCSFDHSIDEQEEADLHFIADSDPRYVLDDLAAKRRIIRLLKQHDAAIDQESRTAKLGDPLPDNLYAARDALREAVRLLALPFAGHPEYREEWTP